VSRFFVVAPLPPLSLNLPRSSSSSSSLYFAGSTRTNTNEVGSVWYNFYYVRGTYLSTVEQPIITERRHYYEDWVGRAGALDIQVGAPYGPEREFSIYTPVDSQSCYALAADDDPTAANIGYYYDPNVEKRYRMK
jgi:hypothetical protein